MKKNYKIIILLTLVLTSFLLGVFFSDKIKKTVVNNISKTQINQENEHIKRTNVFSSKLEEVGILNKKDLNLDKFWNIYSIIKRDFYDIEKVKKTDLIDGVSKGLVDALGDRHSEYFSKKENEEFEKMFSGDFEGIGAVVNKLDFGVKVERVLKGSPAEKYGIRNNDIIIEANGEKLENLTLYEAVSKIKGPAGTKVKLKILRPGEKKALDIEVIRGKVQIPAVEEKYFKEENLGYISLNNIFGNNTALEFSKSLKNLENKKVDGLIIDLRNNGGGLLIGAVEILSNFIEHNKLLVTVKYKNRPNEVYTSINNGKIFDKKIVVLINEGSASASEITSLALSEYQKAILVGTKSYGKGSVQKPFELGDGSMVKLTIAKWFSPKDKNIDGKGIDPDIKVEFRKEDYDFEECIKVGKCDKNLKEKDFKFYDRQLEEAKKILKKFAKKANKQVVIDEENERLGNKKEEEKK